MEVVLLSQSRFLNVVISWRLLAQQQEIIYSSVTFSTTSLKTMCRWSSSQMTLLLTIQAMAEGLICETAKGFRESLINPFSKRFLWADSCPRGPTWCALDEAAAMRKNYCHHLPTVRTTPKGGMIPKGLKLILLHNFP